MPRVAGAVLTCFVLAACSNRLDRAQSSRVDEITKRSFPSPLSVPHAEEILTKTRNVSYGLMWQPKRQSLAFNGLFDQSDARERFVRLSVHAGTPGRIYAAAALMLIDGSVPVPLLRSLADSRQKVWEIAADVVDWRPASDFSQIDRLRELGETVRGERDRVYDYFNTLSR